MMRLAELEQAVQDHVLAGGELPALLAAAVAPPAEERWQIYTEGYRLRLIEALGLQYPALHTRLGADEFAARIEPFVAATPSVHRSIRDYGEELGAHLRATATTLDDEMLAELAEFEWQLAAAFDAADARPATAADLAALAPADWAELQFRAIPSLRRARTTTNAIAVWRAMQVGAADNSRLEPPAAPAAPIEWLIWRRALATEFRLIEPDEAAALDRLFAGATFGALCESLADAHGGQAALRAASWLKGWLLEGSLLRV